MSPPLTLFALLSAATFLLIAGSVRETQSDYVQAAVFPVGTLVPRPALWHFNGAGIGFPQRSCKADARYVAKVLPSGGVREPGCEQPWCRNNPPEDQQNLPKGLRSSRLSVWRALANRAGRPTHHPCGAGSPGLCSAAGEVQTSPSTFRWGLRLADRLGYR